MSLVGWLKAVRIQAGLRSEPEAAPRSTSTPLTGAGPESNGPLIDAAAGPASGAHSVRASRQDWQDTLDDDD